MLASYFSIAVIEHHYQWKFYKEAFNWLFQVQWDWQEAWQQTGMLSSNILTTYRKEPQWMMGGWHTIHWAILLILPNSSTSGDHIFRCAYGDHSHSDNCKWLSWKLGLISLSFPIRWQCYDTVLDFNGLSKLLWWPVLCQLNANYSHLRGRNHDFVGGLLG